MKIKRLILSLAAVAFAVCFATALYFGIGGYNMYRDALDRVDMGVAMDDIRADEHFVPLDEMPQMYLDAVVAVEDQRFYRHNGIDVIAIGRAVVHDIQAMAFVEGGSTITQQLAKNIFFTQEKFIERKVAEVFMAFALERNYTKDEILELYLNSIYFGEGYTGVGEASTGFFGKAPADMDEGECTLLAGVPNAPSAYAPTVNPELAGQRQAQVVNLMVERGILEAAQAEDILAQAW